MRCSFDRTLTVRTFAPILQVAEFDTLDEAIECVTEPCAGVQTDLAQVE